MSYQLLLFDLDHTLLDFEAGEAVALRLLLAEMGFSDQEAFLAYYKPMNRQLWLELEQGRLTKTELIRTRFSKAFAHFGMAVDGDSMAGRFQYYMGQQGQLFPGAIELLDELRARGYDMAAATNGIAKIQQERLKQSKLDAYFTHVFISEQLGAQKPDPLFYEKIAETYPGFEASKALMIGDSLTADIKGGHQAGIDTVWYNPTRAANTSDVTPTYEVATYDALLALLTIEEEMIRDEENHY